MIPIANVHVAHRPPQIQYNHSWANLETVVYKGYVLVIGGKSMLITRIPRRLYKL